MRQIIASLVSGLLFGIGLVVSGMTDPAKVLNFLDLAGSWDPSLAFVMGGAVAVATIGYRLALRQTQPFLAERFHLPTRTDLDRPLLIGSALFGIGWGMSGLCPGPAVTSIAFAQTGLLVFVPAMLVGMMAARMRLGKAPVARGTAPTDG